MRRRTDNDERRRTLARDRRDLIGNGAAPDVQRQRRGAAGEARDVVPHVVHATRTTRLLDFGKENRQPAQSNAVCRLRLEHRDYFEREAEPFGEESRGDQRRAALSGPVTRQEDRTAARWVDGRRRMSRRRGTLGRHGLQSSGHRTLDR